MIGTTAMRAALAAAGVLAALTLPAAAQTSGPYVRAMIGYDWSAAATFQDRDCSSSGAYFGCGPGVDGLQRAARGWFGSSGAYEIGIGTYAAPAIRVEATLGFRPGFAFSGTANFSKVDLPQPVTATAGQAGVMGFVYADLGTMMGRTGPFQPYVGFGVGLSRNVVGEMLYEFPTLTQPRYSVMPGGVNYDVAVAVAAGVSYRASDRLTIDLGWRWTRFGVVETEEGELFIQYPNSDLTVAIDSTFAVLKASGITLSLRWAL
ncbi:MAG: outer membrane beta-barrel protein [Bauldia sp.]|nr:outer membrane beta-barrel protein [Bauldia sp.]